MAAGGRGGESDRKGRGDTGVPDIDDAKDATRDVRGGERKAR